MRTKQCALILLLQTSNNTRTDLYSVHGQKSKPLPNYQKIVLNRFKVCQWD